ncbi:MAG: CvpA family protein [Lachnospiraceae bacterium]|nr:CvpA family protein [Lachnospiraceae bacterium]
MDYIALGVAVAVLVLAAWRGYRLGIIKMLLYVAVLLITMVLSGILVRPAAEMVKNNTSLYANIEEAVADMIEDHEVTNIEAAMNLPFPEYMLEEIQQAMEVDSTVADVAAEVIASQIFNAIVYICLNILIYVILRIIVSALGIVAQLPVIKEVNKLAGFAVGVLEGIVILWLLCLLLQACGSEEWAQDMFVQINNSDFLSWIYNHNLLVGFIKNIV